MSKEKEEKKKKLDKDVLSAFATLDKRNPEAKFLSESALSTVNEWFDTGCMVLNSVISGSLYGGVPKGRITGFSGPSQTGKTVSYTHLRAHET